MKARKKLLIVGVAILGIFALVNIVWFSTVYVQWSGYLKKVNAKTNDDMPETRYEGKINEEYSVTISRPSYLRFDGGGFMCVHLTEPYQVYINEGGKESANREIDIALYFWPNAMKEYRCGVMFNDDLGQNMYQLYLDKKLNIIDENEWIDEEDYDDVKGYMNKYKDMINNMYDFSTKKLGLDVSKHIEKIE